MRNERASKRRVVGARARVCVSRVTVRCESQGEFESGSRAVDSHPRAAMLTQRLFTPRLASERRDTIALKTRGPQTLVRNDTRPERTKDGRDAGNGNEFEARRDRKPVLSDVDP